MIAFLGTSHAAVHLRDAAVKRGLAVAVDPHAPFSPDLIFISEDTPTDEQGNRDLAPILGYVNAMRGRGVPIVLTSQVPPGFTRSLGIKDIWHQAETLRIKDAEERALRPDYIIVGGPAERPAAYNEYLAAFRCPKIYTDWESAEFSKIAVNMTLAAQVENTNRLAAAAGKCGALWSDVSLALGMDKRIGAKSYLTPGRWQDSKHLYRDHVTLEAILAR